MRRRKRRTGATSEGTDDCCPAREPGDVEPGPAAAGQERHHRHAAPVPNGNLHPHRAPGPQAQWQRGGGRPAGAASGPAPGGPEAPAGRGPARRPGPGGRGPLPSAHGQRTCVPEEPPVPPMDWEALEKHLAGLQFREQQEPRPDEDQLHLRKLAACSRAHTRTHPAHGLHAPSRARASRRPHSFSREGGAGPGRLSSASPGYGCSVFELSGFAGWAERREGQTEGNGKSG